MRSKDCIVFLFAAACLAVSAISSPLHAQCVDGTIACDLQVGGSYDGLYKYTVTLNWDTPQGLSNITMDCGFGECVDQVCLSTFLFDSPAGTSNGACIVRYEGEFNCQGNPSIGFTDPVIKWDAVSECEPGNMGTATLCFYTSLGPAPGTSAPLFLVKNGQNVCSGAIYGDCPAPPCIVSIEGTSWGAVKVRYR